MLTRTVVFASSIALMHALVGPASVVATTLEGRHCAYRLEATRSQPGHVVHARAVLVGCFSTFARALEDGSKRALIVPRDMEPQALTDATLAAFSVGPRRGSVLIGTEFNFTGYVGESNSYFAPDSCQGNTYEVSPLPGAWDNRLESGKGFGGCDHNKKFAGPSLGGDSITCTPNCNTYGSLNNEVSSLRWRP